MITVKNKFASILQMTLITYVSMNVCIKTRWTQRVLESIWLIGNYQFIHFLYSYMRCSLKSIYNLHKYCGRNQRYNSFSPSNTFDMFLPQPTDSITSYHTHRSQTVGLTNLSKRIFSFIFNVTKCNNKIVCQ